MSAFCSQSVGHLLVLYRSVNGTPKLLLAVDLCPAWLSLYSVLLSAPFTGLLAGWIGTARVDIDDSDTQRCRLSSPRSTPKSSGSWAVSNRYLSWWWLVSQTVVVDGSTSSETIFVAIEAVSESESSLSLTHTKPVS